jgi:DNA processing protein
MRELQGQRHEIHPVDELYPEMLRDMPAPPEALYVIGNPEALSLESVSVVGARKATSYGLACARLAAIAAAEMGLQVVSGAAIGCDQAAQRQALAKGAPTLAVLGSGADVVYPSGARDMLEAIVARGGAVVSITPWGTPPERWTFPNRNAVVAALSRCLVISEAGMPSGTFSTAQFAEELGRETLVFPGSVFSPNSVGSNFILATQPSAMPIWDRECLELAYSRIYGVLRHPPSARKRRRKPGSELEEQILASLQAAPCRPNELAADLGADAVAFIPTLSMLELDGRVVRLRDGRYSLSEREFLSQNTYLMR